MRAERRERGKGRVRLDCDDEHVDRCEGELRRIREDRDIARRFALDGDAATQGDRVRLRRIANEQTDLRIRRERRGEERAERPATENRDRHDGALA